jgi:hypothetical protein
MEELDALRYFQTAFLAWLMFGTPGSLCASISANNSLNIASRSLFDNSDNPFMPLADDTYWLTADIETGAAGQALEPCCWRHWQP